MRKYASQQAAAAHFGVTDRTIRNWISRGLITGFMLPNQRGIRVDLNEVESMIRTVPTVRTPMTAFGPNAKIVRVVEAEPSRAEQ